jgi:hypothetical protein
MFFIINLKYYLILNILMDKYNPLKKYNPFKPKPWEVKSYRIDDIIDYDNINKMYADFVTLPYNEINDYFNKNYIFSNKTEDGKTLIHAILNNDGLDELEKKQIIEKLIHLNVSINAIDNYNQVPLHVACKKGYNSIIELLINHKAIKDPVDNYGNAPIHYYIDNFVKECKNSDLFNNKKLLITSKKKNNSSIIMYLLLTEILNFIIKSSNIKKYNDIIIKLIDLIPYFKINDVNTKVKKVNENIDKLHTNISSINIKKDINKLVNDFKDDLYTIYDNYKLSDKNIYDEIEFNKEIDNKLIDKNKDKIKKEYDEIKENIKNIQDKIFPENNDEGDANYEGLFNKSINCITESLFLLRYIYNKNEIDDAFRNILSRPGSSGLQPLHPNRINKIETYIRNKIEECNRKFFFINLPRIDFYNYLLKEQTDNLNSINSQGLDVNINIKLKRTLDTNIDNKFILTKDDNFDTIENYNEFTAIRNKDPINFLGMTEYKYNNIHFIFKLLYKIFTIDALDINLDINDISYNNILDIYNKYELVICIINNLTLIYKNLEKIQHDKDIEKIKQTFSDIKEIFIKKDKITLQKINYMTYDNILILLESYINQIEGLLDDYDVTKLKRDINGIYLNLKDLIIKYNKIIVLINEFYSINYFEEFKKYYYDISGNKIMKSQMIYNQFNILDTSFFPDNIDNYIRNYIDENEDIIIEKIKELYLYCDTFNYNKIYNLDTNGNQNKKLKFKKLEINVKDNNTIVLTKKDYDSLAYDDKFYTGFYTNDNEIDRYIYNTGVQTPPENKLYEEKFAGLIDKTRIKSSYYLTEFNDLDKIEEIPIVSIFNYRELLYIIMYKISLELIKECNKKSILSNVLNKFLDLTGSKKKLVSKENKENKKIIKNLIKIIDDNDKVGDNIIITHLNNLMNIIIDHQFTLNSIKISKILLGNVLFKKFSINEYDLFINESFNEDILTRIKNLTNSNVGTFILGDYQNINFIGDKTNSNRLIQNVCINTNNIDIIQNFHFNLRIEDKNGNTIIHRLIDQYNYYAIKILLGIDKYAVTYKNHANQDAKEYLINLINIISKEYSKNEINKRLENYAFILENEIKSQGFTNIEINNQPKYIQVILYNCINQFNDFMWLCLYEFKNNITLSTIKELKNIILKENTKNNLIEDLIMNNLTSYSNSKILLKNMFIADKINDKISQLYNQNNCEICDLKKSIIEFQNLLAAKNKKQNIMNDTEINEKIKNINAEISKKEIENQNIKIVLNTINNVDVKCCNLFTKISEYKLIENLKLNFDKFSRLSKELCEDYFKILNLIYTLTKDNDNNIYMCNFNYKLINIKLDTLSSNDFLNYENYFTNFINTIFEDYNDLEKYEDFEVNYVNYTILNIIKINLVNTISCEIYNYIVKYFIDKYVNDDNKDTIEMYNKNKKEILKNIKDFINNKIYDKLNLKNPDKEYKNEDDLKNLIKQDLYISITQKRNDDDDKEIDNILKFYSFISENIAYHYYEEIVRYLNDLRKIILLLKIYNIIK